MLVYLANILNTRTHARIEEAFSVHFGLKTNQISNNSAKLQHCSRFCIWLTNKYHYKAHDGHFNVAWIKISNETAYRFSRFYSKVFDRTHPTTECEVQSHLTAKTTKRKITDSKIITIHLNNIQICVIVCLFNVCLFFSFVLIISILTPQPDDKKHTFQWWFVWCKKLSGKFKKKEKFEICNGFQNAQNGLESVKICGCCCWYLKSLFGE